MVLVVCMNNSKTMSILNLHMLYLKINNMGIYNFLYHSATMVWPSSSTQKHFHTLKLLRKEINTQGADKSFPKNKTLHFQIFQTTEKSQI